MPVDSVISIDQLVELLAADAPRPSLLDVRWTISAGPQRQEYLEAHLPRAVFIELDRDLAAPAGAGGRHPLPEARAFEEAMREAGVSNKRPVVVYDAASSMAAARAWWLLRYFGHPHVAVLDGGFRAWRQANRPLESGAAAPERGSFTARPGGMPLLDAAAAARLAERGLLLDARAPERYRGEHEPIDSVAGHIPGAKNRPATENVDAAQRFRPHAELREAFERLGAGGGVEIGAYCGSGVTAAHEVLALELAGYRAALYAGSWSEWITDARRPIARGGDYPG